MKKKLREIPLSGEDKDLKLERTEELSKNNFPFVWWHNSGSNW